MEFLTSARKLLENNGIDESRLVSELLMCDVLGCDRIRLYLDFEKPLSHSEIDTLNRRLDRRLKNEPLQFIQSKANFFGYEFYVDGRVLIPRPETEILLEVLLNRIVSSKKNRVEILDVGSGSGCIPVALGKELDKKQISYVINSIDISDDALEVARINLELNKPFTGKIGFHKKDIFDLTALKRNVDYIVSNPPYISQAEYEKLSPEVRDYEPATALTDGGDGLSFYRKLFGILASDSFEGELLCEIGFGQRGPVEELLRASEIYKYTFVNDYDGIPRIVHIIK